MDYLGKIQQGVSDRFGQQYGDQFGQFAQGFGGGQGGGQGDGQYGGQDDGQYGGQGDGQYGGQDDGQYGGQGDGQFGGQSGGLSQWGSSKFYGVKNVATGMYLAAHPDGQLVAEDDTTGHHDVPWRIYTTQDGRVALKSCHNKYLDTDGQGLPTNNAQDPNRATWELVEQDQGIYSLRSPNGQFLQAVAPYGDEQQVLLSNRCGRAEVWQVEPLSDVMGTIDDVEGKFF